MRPLALFRTAAASILFLAASALGAATIEPGSLSFVPLRCYAGDEVVVRAEIRPEKGEKLEELDLKPGSGLPAQAPEADPELLRLKIERSPSGWTLECSFVPWSPGRGALPGLRRGGLRIPPVPYNALSLLGPEDRDPTPPRPQRDLPGAAPLLLGIVMALAVLVLTALAVPAYLLPAARRLIERRRAGLPFRRLDECVAYLLKESGGAESSAFLAALIRALRLYLSARFLPGAQSLSAAEMAALPDSAFPAPGTKARTAALVSLADERRFGGREPSAPREPGGTSLSMSANPDARPSAGALSFLESAALEARAIGAANEEALLARL